MVSEGGTGGGKREVRRAVSQIREADSQGDLVFGSFVRNGKEDVPRDRGVLEVQLVRR